MSNILVIAAHPDDEVLGCGGTVARRAAEGHRVEILILGEGATSRADGDCAGVERLRTDARKAASILGAANVRFVSLPDNRFDTVALLDVVQEIETVVEAIQPETVFTQHGGDLNIDHAVTFRAALTALRPMQGCCVRSLYAYEAASSTEWAFQRFSPVFNPSFYVDISAFLDQKTAAMEAYESERRSFPHPRSPEALRALAALRGSTAGMQAAEAFETIWKID